MTSIILGSKVRDSITGFEGIAIGKTEWLNGCVRISIQPHGLKDGKPFDAVSFDIQQLELVESPPTTMDAEHAPAMPGGPMPDVERAQDPVTRL